MAEVTISTPHDQSIHYLRLLPLGRMSEDASHQERERTEPRVFQLDARFATGGAWAGASRLIEAAYLGLLEVGEKAIVEEHDYELYMALPGRRHTIRPRYLCLTDTAVGLERTRFYPMERAYRLVHGLVGMTLQWKRALNDQSRWVIVVRNFDHAQHLATRFFADLARRGAVGHGIEVIIETQSDRPAVAFGMETISAPVPIAVGSLPGASVSDAEATALAQRVAEGPEAILEEQYPILLEYYRQNGDDLAAARTAFDVLSIYNRRGYYHEAKSFIDDILPHFDQLVGKEESRRMNAIIEMNSCLVATGDGARALRLVTEHAVPYVTKPDLLANMHYMLAMHHLRYLEARDTERAEQHIMTAVENIRVAKDNSAARDHAFMAAFIDNGLAFLRVRQKRQQEALDLCRSGYESVTNELGEDRHLLHRSVLQYNMAQVYVMLGRLDEGLECYRTAASMDPYYTEYLTEIGNILQQFGRNHEAIEYYTRAIKCSPPYPEVYLSKAVSHAHLGELAEALSCSAISLELNPNQPELRAARAGIFTELGRLTEAIAEYDQGIGLAPDAIAMRVNRAVLRFNGGLYELALADMNEVIALEPQETAHYENRAAIYQALDRHDLYAHDLEMAERCKELA
jgi:tetratricopeptide (TPR) repeat protein